MRTPSSTPGWATFTIAALSVLLVMAAMPVRAGAYVLEGPHVLDLTARAMGKIAALRVEQKLIVYPQTPETAPTVFDETAVYVMPERFRSDIVSERVRRTHLVFADSSLTVIDGRLAVGDDDPFDRYQQLLRSRTRPRLMKTLNRLGVETAISSLGRVDETVVFVLGAHYPDESVSQLAIDKETFLPVRLLMVDKKNNDDRHLEIVYRNWQKVQSGWFPFQVLFRVNGRLDREIRVADLRINPSIPAELMDPEALKASAAALDADTSQGQKQEAVEAVQQAVEDFQKKFE
jgi:hypothetical protein